MSTHLPDMIGEQAALFSLPSDVSSPPPPEQMPTAKPPLTVPPGSMAAAAVTYLDHLKAGRVSLPARPTFGHRIVGAGAVAPETTVWDNQGVSRVTDPTMIMFTPEQVDALLLSWVILYRTFNADLTPYGVVHGAALKECAAYMPPFVKGHTTIFAWHQHAEALHAISKYADARIVAQFMPKVPPPKMTKAQAARSAAQTVGGWGPILRSLLKARKTLAAAPFVMGTGRLLGVGAPLDGGVA